MRLSDIGVQAVMPKERPDNPYEISLPEGDYPVQIEKIELKASQTKTDVVNLQIEVMVLNGPCAGQMQAFNLCVKHPDLRVTAISTEQLCQLYFACGYPISGSYDDPEVELYHKRYTMNIYKSKKGTLQMGSPKPITQADNMQAPPVMNPIQYSMPGQAAANAAPLQPAHQNPPAAPAGQPVSYGAPAPQSFMMPGQPTGQPSQGFTPYKN